jgi:uncharacterized protein with FMN-binding domain
VKRAPIVIAGTLAGLIAVLEFHTTPAKVALAGRATLPSQSKSTGAAGPNSAGTPAGRRSAVGARVNYSWGILSVKVTMSGRKLTSVGIAYLDDGNNPRSQFIDQQSIPMLEQQALEAQSANIQGVSGASYTSAGFSQSLQSALHSLGLQ